MLAVHSGSIETTRVLCKCSKVLVLEVKKKTGVTVMDVAMVNKNPTFLRMLLGTLIKRHNISNFEQLMEHHALTSDMIDNIETRSSSPESDISNAMKYFLKILHKDCIQAQNFELLKTIVDTDLTKENVSKKEINNKFECLVKTRRTVSNILLHSDNKNNNSSRIMTQIACSVTSMIKNKQVVNDTLMMIAFTYDKNNFIDALTKSVHQSIAIDSMNARNAACGLSKFRTIMNIENNPQAEVLQDIVRIKNTFGNIKNWDRNKLDDYGYCDIKINVLIKTEKYQFIGEIQLLLSFMLKAKKMGHVFYSFVRNKEVYDEMKSLSKEYFENGITFEKLKSIIATKNYHSLSFCILYGQWPPKMDYKTLIQLCKANQCTKGEQLLFDFFNR